MSYTSDSSNRDVSGADASDASDDGELFPDGEGPLAFVARGAERSAGDAGGGGAGAEAGPGDHPLLSFSAAYQAQHPGGGERLQPPSPARQGKATEQQPPQPPQPPPQEEEEEARLPPLPTKPHYAPIFEFLAVLGEYDNFTMAALVSPQRAGLGESGIRTLYVHSKTCIVDGEWATVGSANLVDLSLMPNHTEMNVAFWDGATALGLLNELTGSHLQVPWHNAVWRHDGTGRAQVEALTDAARTNSISLERRNTLSAGRMLQLDPAQYASMT